jgi:hypothetical protein
MKVAFLSREYPPESAWGGIATVYYTLACALAERGHEVHVICQAASEPRDFIDNGVFVHRVGTNPKRYSAMARIDYSIQAWLKLRSVIKQHDIEIVEASYWGAEALLYSLKKRTPLVVRSHTSALDIIRTKTYSREKELITLKILSILEDLSAKRADRVIANSKGVYTRVLNRLHIAPERVRGQTGSEERYSCPLPGYSPNPQKHAHRQVRISGARYKYSSRRWLCKVLC